MSETPDPKPNLPKNTDEADLIKSQASREKLQTDVAMYERMVAQTEDKIKELEKRALEARNKRQELNEKNQTLKK